VGRLEPTQERGKIAERKFVRAAQLAFAEHGYAGARVSDIVKEAGSSTGNFYFRFKNKEALFEFMLAEFLDRARGAVAEMPDDAESVEALLLWMISRNAQLLEQNHGFYRAVNEVSIRHPETWQKLRDITREIGDVVVIKIAPFKPQIKAVDWKKAVHEMVEVTTGYMANQAVHHMDSKLDSAANINLHFRTSLGILGIAQ
jgi:AcrR family transcriptional regulator